MKKLKFKPIQSEQEGRFQFSKDVFRIISILKHKGFEISFNDAKLAWEQCSEDFCASWLILPEYDEDVYKYISKYVEEYEYG